MATDYARYINLVVGLAEDPAHRTRIRETMSRNAGAAFADSDAVDALARLLLDA